jgi:cyclohexyl-isocyanide hydratase
VDRNRITGAGVTSGIDCALTAIGLAASPAVAQRIQLIAEYDPKPPYDAGTPGKADPQLVAGLREALGPLVAERSAVLRSRAAATR